jgi:hypothetical protein
VVWLTDSSYEVGVYTLLAAMESGDADDFAAAVEDLRAATASMAPRDRALTLGAVGDALGGRYREHGSWQDAMDAMYYLTEAVGVARGLGDTDLAANMRAQRGLVETVAAGLTDEPMLAELAVEDLEAAVEEASDSGPWRANARQLLALARSLRDTLTLDGSGAALPPEQQPDETPLTHAGRLITRGIRDRDLVGVDAGLTVLRQVAADPGSVHHRDGSIHHALGSAYLLRHKLSEDPADLDTAIAALEGARAGRNINPA